MRTIIKAAEPASLTTHRNTPHGTYDNYQDKDTLRTALVAEQRGSAATACAGSTTGRFR